MTALQSFQSSNQIQRCFWILEFVMTRSEGITGKEVADYFGAPASTVHRLLQQLVDLGYLEQDTSTKKYYLGIKMFRLAQQAFVQMKPLVTRVEPILTRLHEELNENVYFYIHSLTGLNQVLMLKGDRPIAVNTRPPEGRALHATSSGKLYLASCAPAELESYIEEGLPRYTPNTITDPAALKREIRLIKKQGYAVDNEEHWQGVRCMSVPVTDKGGKQFGIVSVQIPAIRYATYEPFLLDRLMRTAQLIAEALEIQTMDSCRI